MTDEEPFDIGTKLKQRLEATKEKKETTQKKINDLNNELQVLFVKVPKRPRESVTELDEKINALEFKRTTNSMILSDEKRILKDIYAHQRTKTQLEEYNAYERKVQEKKGQLTDLRESLKTTNAAIDELEAALAKIQLAHQLDCTPSQLQNLSIVVPTDKIGRVIGKNGATIKNIETTTKVVMDVDSVAGKIHLTGAESSLAKAIEEIDKITMAIDVSVQVSTNVLTYLTTKRIDALTAMRNNHPDVQMDAFRDKGVVTLRGLSDAVAQAKADLEAMELVTDTRILIGKESAIVVGKAGSTINRLTETHKVVIDVNETGEDVFTCTVIGPEDCVQAAAREIDAIMEDNKDIIETVVVDSIVRNTLLTDSGAPIKALQKKVNANNTNGGAGGGGVQLSFAKEDDSDRHVLQIRGRRAVVGPAKELVESTIHQIRSSLVTITVDPFIVPKIIGKGGDTIKKLKIDSESVNSTSTEDGAAAAGGGTTTSAVNIEVDKVTGKIVLQSQDPAQVRRVQAAIQKIIDENQIERISLDDDDADAGAPEISMKPIFRELVRSDKRNEINALVWMGLDDEGTNIILRGTRENCDKVAKIVNDFIAENYIQEIEIAPEDEPTLFAGGVDSPIQKFQTEYGAELNVIRSRYIVLAKGHKTKVKAAVKRLNQFLHGGDGFTVSRMSVTEQALGVVIGKNGSKRAELEKKHSGVNLFIHRSNRITIRGPDEAVEACRIDILRLVSSVKIQQVMPLTPEEHEILTKPDAMRRATQGIPVQVTLTDDAIKVRGIFADVRDAQALIKEVLTGTYEANVELEASQMSKVRGACRDPSHLERMETTTSASVKLDLATSSIVISGKRGNVRKAKHLVVSFLDFLLPESFARLEISKPLQTSVAEAAALADCAAVSGAKISLDRDLSSILIQSSDPAKVKAASDLLKSKIAEAEKLAFVVNFGASESWLIPLIIGKGGNRINALRLETKCEIDVNKVDRSVTITGDDETAVAKARQMLDQMLDEARRQCAFVDLPPDAVAAFLGRGGSHIRTFATENKVEVERMRKSPTKVKITGDENDVLAATKALQAWLEQWEQRQAGRTMSIDKPSIPAVLGKQGSVISALQKEYNCKVEINREELTLTVRGGTEDSRDKAIEKIKQIVAEDRERHLANGNTRRNGDQKADGEASEATSNGHKAASPKKAEPAPKSNDSLSTFDSAKDRSGEFPRRPVGLTVVEKEVSKPKKKRNRNKNGNSNGMNGHATIPGTTNSNGGLSTSMAKNNGTHHVVTKRDVSSATRDISDDSTLQVGTSAGRSLFNLLVSEPTNTVPSTHHHHHHHNPNHDNNKTEAVKVNEEQWDSSTVSSAAMESSDAGEESGKKPYIKSASGFTVRV